MTENRPEAFRIEISDREIDDLRRRILSTRWPADVANEDWNYGVELEWMREIAHYWAHDYDWRPHERAINAHPHYRVEIDGQTIHYMQIAGKGARRVPLVASHGWPWTFWDMRGLIDPLTKEVDGLSFDVVIPSLPGFGWSTPLSRGHFTTAEIGDLWVRLMTEVLGYERFCTHGGDWGAIVGTEIGHAHADKVWGIHQSLAIFPGLELGAIRPEEAGPGEEDYAERTRERMKMATSHVAVQGTDPQTLAYGLADSPVGMAAWLFERRRNWSDCARPDGSRDLEAVFDREDLCTYASLYWFSASIESSLRMYPGRFRAAWQPRHDRMPVVEAPVAMAVCPGDLIFVPRKAAERVANIRRWTVLEAGGHFAAAEVPEAIAADVRAFYTELIALES